MSGNDQPPTTPENTGSEPDDEPTPVDPSKDDAPEGEPTPVDPSKDDAPEGEPGFVIEPPPPGESDAQASGKNSGLIIAVAAAVAIVLIGGGFLIWVLVGGDDDDDKKEETSISDFCDVIKSMDESEGTAEDPTIVSDALRDAGTPEDMSDDEKDGRELLIDIGDDSADGPAAEKAVSELDEDDTAKVQAFIDYITKVCAEPTPTESPS